MNKNNYGDNKNKPKAINNEINKQNKKTKNISQTNVLKNKILSIKKLCISELNNLDYKEAVIKDKRTFCEYYISLIRTKHILVFSFYHLKDDYNSKVIKIDLFFSLFVIYFGINTLFFNDSTMHQIYIDNGSFNLNYQIPHILYSSLISGVLNSIIKFFALSENNIISFKKKKNNLDNESNKLVRILFCKFIIFFILSIVLLCFFWYYISSFCAVYRNTQIHLIKDTLISFSLSTIYQFFTCLLPGIFRINSLRSNKNRKEILYKFSKMIQFFL